MTCLCQRGMKSIVYNSRIVSCDSQLWAIQHTCIVQEQINSLQRMRNLLRLFISAIHSQRALFPYKDQDPGHVNCSTHNWAFVATSIVATLWPLHQGPTQRMHCITIPWNDITTYNACNSGDKLKGMAKINNKSFYCSVIIFTSVDKYRTTGWVDKHTLTASGIWWIWVVHYKLS